MTSITRLKRIEPLQFGKVLALCYGLMSLLLIPVFLLFGAMAMLAGAAQNGGGPPAILGAGFGLVMAILMPVFYAAMGFITGFLGALIYNLVAKWIGGLELEFEERPA